jgi:hypothetical protein
MKIVSHGLNTFGEAGKYGCATAEYTSLVSYSYLKRGGNVVVKITSPVTSAISGSVVLVKDGAGKVLGKTTSGLKAFNEAGKYSCATVEYAGLVSYSCLKRGGSAVAKITSPVTSAVSRPFAYIRYRASKVLGKVALDPEVLKGLEEKIREIERRLASIEKHGLVTAARPIPLEKETRLDSEKRNILRAIVEENILLRGGENDEN